MSQKPAIGFEQGEIVPAVDFQYPQDEPLRERQELLSDMLAIVPVDSVAGSGQRFLAFLFLLGRSECRTQRELAKRLKVTPGRVTQILNALRTDFTEVLGRFPAK